MRNETTIAKAVREVHDGIRPPEGCRVEIAGGVITVAPPPVGKHAWIVRHVRIAVEAALPPTHGAFENTTLEEPRVDRYVPDLAVWPIALVKSRAQWVFPGSSCRLAVEVTSPPHEARDYAKAAGYARCSVPVYLLVDQEQRRCVVFTEPGGGRYLTRREVLFGGTVTLPLEPAAVTIATAAF